MTTAASIGHARRGGAVFTLAGVLLAWAAIRIVTWSPPFERDEPVLARAAGGVESVAAEVEVPALPVQHESVSPSMSTDLRERQSARLLDRMAHRDTIRSNSFDQSRALSPDSQTRTSAENLISHILLQQAGYREAGPAAPHFADAGQAAPYHVPQVAQDMRGNPAPSRWSMDAWALWREESSSPLLSGRPSYGRSQIGAVMRYRLAPASGHAPQLHLRGSAALEGRQEREVAFGASARPLPDVPVRLAAEARVSETDRGTEMRGAGYAVSELPTIGLPGGLSAEAYLQAGYVTGEFATPFVDGQARITRPIIGAEGFRLEAGAGAWGGAQEDAQRLDVGPSAGVNFRIGPARGRVSADYRFRVAGDAEPSSGPALTLSAGF